MYNLVTLETAIKLKKLGVNQESLFYFYCPWIVVDEKIYTLMCKERNETKDLNKLTHINYVGWVVPAENNAGERLFKTSTKRKKQLPEHYVEKVSAFDLSELLRIYGEDIKILHGVTNYTEFVAQKLIENLNEVNELFS